MHAKDSSLTLETQFYLANILEILAIPETRYMRKKDEEEEGVLALNYLISLFYKGKEIIDKINISDKVSLLWLLCKPMIQRIKDYIYDYQYNYFKPVVEIIQKLEHLFDTEDYDEYWDIDYNEEKREQRNKLWYGNDSSQSSYKIPDRSPEEQEEYDLLEKIELKVKSMFWNGESIKDISDYIQQQDIPLWRKIESYWDVSNDFIHKLSQCGDMVQIRKNIAELPWKRALELLDYEEQFWLSVDDDSEDNSFYEYHYSLDAYRAICYAYLEGRSKKFDEYMQELLGTFKFEFELAHKYNSWNKYYYCHFDDIRIFHPVRCMAEIFDNLRHIEKQYLAFPYLIDCVKIVETENVDAYDMFSWYKTIVEFASDGGVFTPNEEQDKLFDIEMEYQDKIDKIVTARLLTFPCPLPVAESLRPTRSPRSKRATLPCAVVRLVARNSPAAPPPIIAVVIFFIILL